jgi:predicted nuclease of predicted toxin-antitoxin system
MRVLIDACLPAQVKARLGLAGAATARELGWQQKKNSELLAAAQDRFDVLLTMDKGMPDQQKLSGFGIAVVVLRARSNRLAGLLPLLPEIHRVLPLARKGHAVEIWPPL